MKMAGRFFLLGNILNTAQACVDMISVPTDLEQSKLVIILQWHVYIFFPMEVILSLLS